MIIIIKTIVYLIKSLINIIIRIKEIYIINIRVKKNIDLIIRKKIIMIRTKNRKKSSFRYLKIRNRHKIIYVKNKNKLL